MPVVRISDELFKEVQKYAEPLVDNFETALWKALKAKDVNMVKSGQPETSIIRSRKMKLFASGELTHPKEFWRPILNTLVENGGSVSRQEVIKILEKKLAPVLKPSDKETNRDGTLKWVKQVDYQRLSMANQGLIRKNSSSGIWEITDNGRQWLARH